jgi:hypothetical protein
LRSRQPIKNVFLTLKIRIGPAGGCEVKNQHRCGIYTQFPQEQGKEKVKSS